MNFLCWSIASECFLETNFTLTRLLVLVAFLPSGSLWKPSISKLFTWIPESLQISMTVSSRLWSETSLEFPFTLLRLLYGSDLDCCFSRFKILFWKIWLTFLTIKTWLFNFLLAVTRRSTFSESLEIWLNKPWISLPTTTFSFKFSIWSTSLSSSFH